MSDPITIQVRGIPKPGGSKRHVGNGILIDSSGKAGADWRGDCKTAALIVMGSRKPLTVPLEVAFWFTFPRPNKHFKGKARTLRPDAPRYVTRAPDTTKLVRSIEDALTGIVWKDDAIISRQFAEKVYGDTPGAVVVIKEVAQ